MGRGAAAMRKHDMTSRSSFRLFVRSRMQKTGESYTAARTSLLSASEKPKAAEPVEPRFPSTPKPRNPCRLTSKERDRMRAHRRQRVTALKEEMER